MINQLNVKLQAINESRNLYRSYNIYVGHDLFDTWLLTTDYGRIGKVSQTKTYSFYEFDVLKRKLKQIIGKRLRSEKRIGVNYKVVSKLDQVDHLEKILDECFC